MRTDGWIGGNQLRLLENGEEFFPAVFAAIEAARHEVLLETFILFEDKVGLALHAVLIAAARRGVVVNVTIDGFGSPDLSSEFVAALTEAGVQLHVFDPPPRLSRRLRPFRRLHRKIVTVDGWRGFIGGLNFSADHLADFGPQAKQDYAVEAKGPIVALLRRLVRKTIAPEPSDHGFVPPYLPAAGRMLAQLVTRDNHRHRDDIERHYRHALHQAQREVIIANAYFFPGYLLLNAIRRAARRGVKVRLILQGCPDLPLATFAARQLYEHLLRAGVRIYEYCERPMHGKVALIDEDWATVGSSNLDPLSLSLNLEANVVIRDRGFNAQLRQKLTPLLKDGCVEVRSDAQRARRWWWRMGISYLVFHFLRHFPGWIARLPAGRPRVAPASETALGTAAQRPDVGPAWQWRGSE